MCGALDPVREAPAFSPNALFNLSKLAVWWLRLGIAIERIKPGQPQQNMNACTSPPRQKPLARGA